MFSNGSGKLIVTDVTKSTVHMLCTLIGSLHAEVLIVSFCRSQRLRTASLLSAGSSELTGAAEQGDERAALGAGKRLTLQQLQVRRGCVLPVDILHAACC